MSRHTCKSLSFNAGVIKSTPSSWQNTRYTMVNVPSVRCLDRSGCLSFHFLHSRHGWCCTDLGGSVGLMGGNVTIRLILLLVSSLCFTYMFQPLFEPLYLSYVFHLVFHCSMSIFSLIISYGVSHSLNCTAKVSIDLQDLYK